MRTNRFPRPIEIPQLELMESRLLLSGDGLAGAADALAVDSASIAPPVVEQESIGGPSNDDPATAQDLSFSYLVPKVSLFDGFGPQQASVLGTADGGGGTGYDETMMLIAGRLAYPFRFDIPFEDAVSPGGEGSVKLSVKADLGGEDKYLTVDAEGLFQTDLFVEGASTNEWAEAQITLTRDQLVTLAADGVIVFTVIPSEGVTDQGTGYVAMQLTYGAGGGTGDFYRFDMTAGESASLSLAGSEAGELTMTVYGPDGAEVAAGQVGADGVVTVEHLLAGADGSYYVSVSGSGDYQLVVNRNAATDLAGNDGLESAQQIDSSRLAGRQWVIGEVGDGDSDFYAVQVGGGKWLDVRAYTPDGEAAPNALEPVINVYDADGDLVATGSGSKLRFRPPRDAGGTYYVEVAGGESTEGDYVLSVKAQPGQAQPGQAKAVKAQPGQAKGAEIAPAGRKGPDAAPGRAVGRRGK